MQIPDVSDVSPAASLLDVTSPPFLQTSGNHRGLTPRRNPGAFAAVIALVLLTLTSCALALYEVALPTADFGLRFGGAAGEIHSVVRGSSAAHAGLRQGDQLVQDESNLRDYAVAIGQIQPRSGQRVHVGVARGLAQWQVQLAATPMLAKPQYAVSVILALLVTLTMLIVATSLVMLRPGWMTWGFFLFALGTPASALPPGAPLTLLPLWTIYLTFCFAAGVAGMLIFLACFPRDDARYTWREWVVRFAVVTGIVLFVALPNGKLGGSTFHGMQVSSGSDITAQIVIDLLYLLGGIAFASSYLESDPRDRQRIAWVAAAIALSLVGLVPTLLSYETENAALQYLLVGLGNLILLPTPIAVAYAVVHHRVVPVKFAISRGLVYTALSSGIIALFAAADWFLGSVLSSARWAVPIEFAMALGMGFWLNSAHRRVDRLVDFALYRRRHEAAVRLGRAIAGLRDAETFAEIDNAVVSEPFECLELTSAAVFRRTKDESFVRSVFVGWPPQTQETIATQSRLCLHIRGQAGPLRLRDLPLQEGLPGGEAAPVVAVPIFLRHRLESIALYGGHRNGGDLDADELQLLERLARAAESAYDSLTAQKAQETIIALRAQLAMVQGS